MAEPPSGVVRVRTPEGVEFAIDLAGPVSRFLAWVVDLAAILLLVQLVTLPTQMLAAIGPSLGITLNILAYFAISIGYGIVWEWRWGGQTLGKRLFRLRVVDEQGLALGLSQVVLRNLLRGIDGLPLLYLLGGVCMVLSPRLQRLGDLAAGTLVVRVPTYGEPDLSQVTAGKYCSLRDHPHLAARLRQCVTPAEASLALRALVRREGLEPAARVALFAALAEHYRGLVAFPQSATDGLSDEQYVRNVVAVVYQAR